MMANDRQSIAARALALCGTRFRLHGRCAEQGLDCIGLVAESVRAVTELPAIPSGYSLRGGDPAVIAAFLEAAGFARRATDRTVQTGDIILVRPHPVQLHLMIRVPNGWVHAHAGLGRVVALPGAAPWPAIATFRWMER